MPWPGERYIPKKEMEKIKQAQKKKVQYNYYLADAIKRTTPKPMTLKLKIYKGE